MNNVASVKDRLKNKSIATGKTVQELLTAYGLERTISKHAECRIYPARFLFRIKVQREKSAAASGR